MLGGADRGETTDGAAWNDGCRRGRDDGALLLLLIAWKAAIRCRSVVGSESDTVIIRLRRHQVLVLPSLFE
jgi:hypothetical protein